MRKLTERCESGDLLAMLPDELQIPFLHLPQSVEIVHVIPN